MAKPNVSKHPARDLGYSLLGPDYMPPGDQELALRDALKRETRVYRSLRSGEIDTLHSQGNSSGDWGNVFVSDRFNPKLIQHCRFLGLVRLGNLENMVLQASGVKLPVGIYHSTIVSCDIGDNPVIDRVGYLAHFLVGDQVILHHIGRMLTTPNAKFGHGILKEGESEEDRHWVRVANENGGRSILAFDGILPADACLWAHHRDDEELMARLKEMTDGRFDPRPGFYGTVGARTAIFKAEVFLDTAIGPEATIDGAARLENLTVRSSEDEPTFIGSDVALSDGIVGYGCRIESGAQARRFVFGSRVTVELGAKVTDTFLGDNAHVAGAELLSGLLLPGHGQHHSSSFLISATLLGQSNIAAGAVIGSNHNSRGPDCELRAGRGFWPGLCTSFSYPSRFASFVLVAKGSYPSPLDVPLPFCLVANDEHEGRLDIMPAYYFMYNLYALLRGEYNFKNRDRRTLMEQHIETECLAPDTVEEMMTALALLERWTGQALLRRAEAPPDEAPDEDLIMMGRKMLEEEPDAVDQLEILADHVERSDRSVRVLKAAAAWRGYREMLHFHGVRTLLAYMEANQIETPATLIERIQGRREGAWTNLGGQLVPPAALGEFVAKLRGGEIDSWDAVHAEYDRLWKAYPEQKARHALAVLLEINDWRPEDLAGPCWAEALNRAAATNQAVTERAIASRRKDYEDPFRRLMYASDAELEAVLGRIEDNDFIHQMCHDAGTFAQRISGFLPSD